VTVSSDTRSLHAPSAAPGDGRAVCIAVAVVLALTALRAAALLANRTDLFVDEAQYWDWSRALAPGYYSKPPLIAWLIAATTAVCGDAEWAIRLGAPLCHGATALLLVAVGRRLYGDRAGAVAGLVYATLPAVAVSSTLISTDVPLLTCWALALFAYLRWRDGGRVVDAIGLGLAIALGLNAKYVMVFFPAAIVLDLAIDRAARARLRAPSLWLAIAVGLAGLVPNLLWNLANGSPTLYHTQSNIGWGRAMNPRYVVEFVASQFGVFGPVALALLLLAALGRLCTARPAADRQMLVFSLPILALFVAEAIVSRAYANWAATAYPAAAVLVGALMAARPRAWWTRASFAIAVVVSAAMLVLPAIAPRLAAAGVAGPLVRLVGWRDLAADVAARVDRLGARTLVVVGRDAAAGLVYQFRHRDIAVATAPFTGMARHHYEMTRPWRPDLPRPALLLAEPGTPVPPPLRAVGPAETIAVAAGVARGRRLAVVPVDWD
jgi:4-amino-4-deoxy-L-arabinose transferase-like glycosyltransferase